MGKGGAIATAIGGVVILLIGVGLILAMFASNTILIIAGPFMILAVILMAIGGYVISRAVKMWEKANEKREQPLY